MERTKDQEWEQARQDAWLREMLTDTSERENEERCGRFESGRWITELFRIPHNTQQQPQEGSVPDRRCRFLPEVVLVRRWVIGVLGIWRGRVWGKGGTGEVSLKAT